MKITSTTTAITIVDKALGSQIAGGAAIVIGAGIALGIGLGGSSNRMAGLAIGSFFVVIGLAMLFLSKGSIITIDKGAGVVSVRKKGLVGGTSDDRVPLSSVTGVVLTISYDNTTTATTTTNSPAGNSRRSTLALALQDGGRVELASATSGSGLTLNGVPLGGAIFKAPLSEQAQQIADFLGLQVTTQDFAAGGLASVGQIVQTIRQAGEAARDSSVAPPVPTAPPTPQVPGAPPSTPPTTPQPGTPAGQPPGPKGS